METGQKETLDLKNTLFKCGSCGKTKKMLELAVCSVGVDIPVDIKFNYNYCLENRDCFYIAITKAYRDVRQWWDLSMKLNKAW